MEDMFCERVASKSDSGNTAQGKSGELDSAAMEDCTDSEFTILLSWIGCATEGHFKFLFEDIEPP